MEDISDFNGVIEFALEKEGEAKALYDNLAARSGSERGNTIFKELAAEEQKHYNALNNLNVGKLKKSFKTRSVTDLKISDYLHEVSFSPDMTYQDILVLAMKSEEHSHSLYLGLAENSDDADLKKLFEFLASQEARHKLRVETEYDDYILTQD